MLTSCFRWCFWFAATFWQKGNLSVSDVWLAALPVSLFIDHFQQRFCVFKIFAVSALVHFHTHTHTERSSLCVLIYVLLKILLFYEGHLLEGLSCYWADETKPSDRYRTWCFIQKFLSLLSVHHGVLVPNVSSLWFRLPVFLSIFLSVSFLCSNIIKVLWYVITVHIYLKSPLGECVASPPLLSLRIIKCYYLHPVRLLSQPLITSTALNKKPR